MIHVEGMGWFGAITTLALERAGVPFTWSDIDTRFQAWRASTGIVYPAGDDRSQDNRQRWIRWVMDGWLPKDTAKLAHYVYSHKAPPHEGKYEQVPWWGYDHLNLAASPAVAVDVKAIVTEARSRFAEQRVPAGGIDRPTIVAHGHDRAAGWVWGWSRKVALKLPHGTNDMVAFYGKRHRFDLVYAYPVPDEPGWWWAGSALVNEKKPHVRTPTALSYEWERWMQGQRELFRVLEVVRVQPFEQGWRPKPIKGDAGLIKISEVDGEVPTIVFPALWHSGVRWAPGLVEHAVAWAASFR